MESILTFLLFFILGPVVKGLIESERTRKQWEQKQRRRQESTIPRAHKRHGNWSKGLFPDIALEKPVSNPIYEDFQDYDLKDSVEKTDYTNLIAEKSNANENTVDSTKPEISNSFSEKKDELFSPLKYETSLLEEIFSGDNLIHALILKEILSEPKARR